MFFSRTLKQDRRRRTRQLLNASVRLFTKSAWIDAVGINVSDNGMCIFTAANLALNSEIQVEFRPLPDTEVMRIRATVRHRALYLYGIEFCADSGQGSKPPHEAVISEVAATASCKANRNKS